uniref:Uncharacterized protein n=1 Tax=Zea mays TaxID=4577 RepID=B4FIA3_MAIZE|nr:unknown [Zea mays]|eukprot:NP_001132834.1 photosynthetic electron transport 2 [Zea mays]
MPLHARAPPLRHSHLLLTAATARLRPCAAPATKPRRRSLVLVRASSSDPPQQQLNLSVLRFTLGIPGLDESYLPRWIGLGFGALVVLNHLLSASPTPAQLVGPRRLLLTPLRPLSSPVTVPRNWLCPPTRRGPRLWGCAWPRSRRRCRSWGGSLRALMLPAECRCPRGASKYSSCLRTCQLCRRRTWRGRRTSCSGTQTPRLWS